MRAAALHRTAQHGEACPYEEPPSLARLVSRHPPAPRAKSRAHVSYHSQHQTLCWALQWGVSSVSVARCNRRVILWGLNKKITQPHFTLLAVLPAGHHGLPVRKKRSSVEARGPEIEQSKAALVASRVRPARCCMTRNSLKIELYLTRGRQTGPALPQGASIDHGDRHLHLSDRTDKIQEVEKKIKSREN